MASTDNLFAELTRNSVMLLSLHGVRTVLERELGIDNLEIAMDETVKAEIERKTQQGEKPSFPYAHLSISSLMGVKDQTNNKHTQRYGIRVGAAGATRGTSRKAYMFPINLEMELHYVTDDPVRAMTMAEAMVILSQIGGLTFALTLGESLEFDVRVEIPESVPIPVASIMDTASPGGIDITLTLIIHTYSGFFREVAAVNSNRAAVSVEVMLDGDKIKTEV